MKEVTRRGLIFGAAALAAVGVFAGVDQVASSTFVKDEPPLAPDATVEIVEFDDTGRRIGKKQLHKVRKTEAEWRNVLTTPQFVVTQRAATEIPYSGELLNEHRAGSEMRALRRASGARVHGWTGPDGFALLHELRGLDVCAATSRINSHFSKP